MKRICFVIVLLGLLAAPLTAAELWQELLPDNGAVLLGVNRNLDGQVIPAGSWDAFQFGGRPVEADVWSISPLGIGASWGILGSAERPRYIGIGYDEDQFIIYAKTQVAIEF